MLPSIVFRTSGNIFLHTMMNNKKKFVVAIPESRQADEFAQLLEANRGKEPKLRAVRCPLVSIQDSPDQQGVQNWLDQLIADRFDYVIFYSGEGIQSLLRFAQNSGQYEKVITALNNTQKITRGSKPIKQLRQLAMKPDIKAIPPTTAGTITALKKLDLTHKHVGVQLYDQEQNQPLMDCLGSAGAAAHVVRPYVYGSDATDQKVYGLIDQILRGEIDLIAFTSSLQVRRMAKVAVQYLGEKNNAPKINDLNNAKNESLRLTALTRILSCTKVASIGPMVEATLKEHHTKADIQLQSGYGLKPFARKIIEAMDHWE